MNILRRLFKKPKILLSEGLFKHFYRARGSIKREQHLKVSNKIHIAIKTFAQKNKLSVADSTEYLIIMGIRCHYENHLELLKKHKIVPGK